MALITDIVCGLNLILYLDNYSCSDRSTNEYFLHSDIYSLDENDIDRVDSVRNNTSVEWMDGY